MKGASDVVLAHGALIDAIPFIVPAFLVVALMAAIVWRDRREDRQDKTQDPPSAA